MRRRQVSRYSRRGVEQSTPLFGKKEAGAEEAPEDPVKHRNAARNTAIGLLARREHAQSEVRRKLRDRGYDADLALEVVDELTRQRLLSDDRFAESFMRARADRGQGPVRLRAELRQLQLPPELIERHLVALEVDWGELATEVRWRKFGNQAPASLGERAKQVRFLQYRGFTADQIRAAFRQVAITDDVDELLVADDSGSPNDYSEG